MTGNHVRALDLVNNLGRFSGFGGPQPVWAAGEVSRTVNLLQILRFVQFRPKMPKSIAANVILEVRVFSLIGDIKFGRSSLTLVKTGIGFMWPEVKNVAMAVIPVEVIVPVLERIGVKAIRFLFQRPFTPGLVSIGQLPIVPEHKWSTVANPATFAAPADE